MKNKMMKKIAAMGAALMMAISLMSVGASAASTYTNKGSLAVNDDTPQTQVCTVYQMRANTWGQYQYTLSHVYVRAEKSSSTKIQGAAGCDACVSGTTAFATVLKDNVPKGTSADVTWGNGVAWTAYYYFGTVSSTQYQTIEGRGTVFY